MPVALFVQVWDPELPADTSKKGNRHQHKLSPYTGQVLSGHVLATFVRGAMMSYHGDVAVKPCGTPVATRATRAQTHASTEAA